jgi:hypothetical protein
MATLSDLILQRLRADGRGARVYAPRDFLDLGSRAGVDQALSRLVRSGALRRVARGLYDWPRQSAVLASPPPASMEAVVDALCRRRNVSIAGSDLAAANALGLTTAVPTRPEYVASRKMRDLKVGGRTLHFKQAPAALLPWFGSPAAPLVQAMLWLHTRNQVSDDALARLRRRASPQARKALVQGMGRLPGWALPLARQIAANHANGPG